ncbi:MAG: hypothetical protein QXZ09_01710 [Candidatus Methanomethylicaceae archaeon]
MFEGWYVLDMEFWVGEKKVFGRWVKWKPATMAEAAQAYDRIGVRGMACFAVAKYPLEWWER